MIVALLFIFILLQIADSLTTVHILKQGGREANPLMNWLFDKVGVPAALIGVKLIALIAVFVAWNEWLTLGLNAAYLGVVGWNSYQIWKSE